MMPPSAYRVSIPALQEAWSSSAFVNPAFSITFTRIFKRGASNFVRTARSTLGGEKWAGPPQEQLSPAWAALLPAGAAPGARSAPTRVCGRSSAAQRPPTPAAAGPERARAPGRRSSGAGGRGRSSAALRRTGRAAAGSGCRRGERGGGKGALARPPVPRSGGSAALLVQQSCRWSEWGGGAERVALRRGVGSRGQRRGGRAMPLTSPLALPVLLLPLPALKLLFSPAAAMAGNFSEGWAQAGPVLRWAPQGTGHAVRWGEARRCAAAGAGSAGLGGSCPCPRGAAVWAGGGRRVTVGTAGSPAPLCRFPQPEYHGCEGVPALAGHRESVPVGWAGSGIGAPRRLRGPRAAGRRWSR